MTVVNIYPDNTNNDEWESLAIIASRFMSALLNEGAEHGIMQS